MEKKNVNTLLDFFISFFDSACPRLKTSIYVHDSGDFFFFFFFNVYILSNKLLEDFFGCPFKCLVYCNFMYYHLLEWSFFIFTEGRIWEYSSGGKKACCNVRKPFKSGSVIANCRCTLQRLEKKVL